MRRALLWVLLIALLLLVITRFTSLAKLGSTLAAARWQWVVAATLTHLIYFLCYAWLFRLAFAAVEVAGRWRELLPVFMASLFVNAVAPSGGASGGALWVGEANRRHRSGARTAVGLLLQLLVDMATLIPFLAYGMAYLALRRDLQAYDIVGPVIYFLGILFFVLALLLAWWRTGDLARVLAWTERQANRLSCRLRRRELLSAGWGQRTSADLAAAVKAVVAHPRLLGATVALSLVLHALNAAGLYCLFLAFRQPVSLGTLVAGFGMGIVFYVVTIVPQGLAAVEGVMALVFTSLGVPSARAVAIVLVFRGLNYWLPLIAGAFFIRQVRAFGGDEAVAAGSEPQKTE